MAFENPFGDNFANHPVGLSEYSAYRLGYRYFRGLFKEIIKALNTSAFQKNVLFQV
jgi:hypothetical protein